MSNYSIALFLHIVGELAMFAALGLEWVGLLQIRNAGSLEQTRTWLGVLNRASKAGFPSMLTTVVTGIYMMATVWGRTPWLIVTIVSLVMVIVLARVAIPRVQALAQSVEAANDPLLWVSVNTRAAITLSIIFLKVVKPNLIFSLLTIGIAILLGFASTLSMRRAASTDKPMTEKMEGA